MNFETAPIKRLFEVSRRMIDPQGLTGREVFHYSLPAWHEFGCGLVERADDLASGKLLLQGNEILVSKLNPEKSVVIQAMPHEQPTLCSPELIALLAKSVVSRFAYYLMLSTPVRYGLEASVESVTNSHKRARVDRFLASRISYPDIASQRAIADFLDRETARIDQLMEKKGRAIELLAERFRTLVRHAVTRGIDPNVETTETAIPHLGRVPVHWQVLGLGKKIVLQRGVDITKDQQEESGNYPVVSSGGVASYHSKFICRGPGVLIGRKGSAGKLHYEERDFWPHDTTLYVKNFFGNLPKFVFYKFMSLDLESFERSSANPTINRNVVHPTKVSWPPPSEQSQIVHFLDSKNETFTRLVTLISESTDRLIEFRSALITAAVTGQIDVATWGKRGATDRRLDDIEAEMAAAATA